MSGTGGGPAAPRGSRSGRWAAALVAVCATGLLAASPAAAGRPGPVPGAEADASGWVGSWGTAPAPAAPDGISRDGLDDRTVRMVVHTSIGGGELRLRLSHAYGTRPLTLGRTTVALPVPGSPAAVVPGSAREVTFDGGASGTTVPAGSEAVSDPVAFDVPAGADLAVSVHLPEPTGPTTWHWLAQQRGYVSEPGDHTADRAGTAFTRTETSWFFLTGVDVRGADARGTRPRGAVVAIGDSQTDGVGSTPDGNGRWTDALARRLAADPATAGVGVLNKGIGGNRVLRDGTETDRPQRGTRALGRLDRDAIAQAGVRTVVLYEGVNDLQLAPYATADDVLQGLRTMAQRLRERGIRVLVGTLTPFKDSPFWTADAERARAELNAALRSAPEFDAVADFDAAVRDPADPRRVRAAYDSGDHIHLNDAGYRALAEAVPTAGLTGTTGRAPTTDRRLP
ncbi:SGNH/GDSL hydrolase family protein [Streptomyces sp. NPDC056527]|uniref:SGNH/GDSL hydrolase family protein n=1 Tax=Streptomyces sp. NPDC056527 TaxID=3345853 RepID=UPI00368BA35C